MVSVFSQSLSRSLMNGHCSWNMNPLADSGSIYYRVCVRTLFADDCGLLNCCSGGSSITSHSRLATNAAKCPIIAIVVTLSLYIHIIICIAALLLFVKRQRNLSSLECLDEVCSIWKYVRRCIYWLWLTRWLEQKVNLWMKRRRMVH